MDDELLAALFYRREVLKLRVIKIWVLIKSRRQTKPQFNLLKKQSNWRPPKIIYQKAVIH